VRVGRGEGLPGIELVTIDAGPGPREDDVALIALRR
jgi:hypothetical protein